MKHYNILYKFQNVVLIVFLHNDIHIFDPLAGIFFKGLSYKHAHYIHRKCFAKKYAVKYRGLHFIITSLERTKVKVLLPG